MPDGGTPGEPSMPEGPFRRSPLRGHGDFWMGGSTEEKKKKKKKKKKKTGRGGDVHLDDAKHPSARLPTTSNHPSETLTWRTRPVQVHVSTPGFAHPP
jgi:hypothetical protein